MGSCEDCKIIEKFLSDNKISVIRAAMIALMKLNPEKYTSHITDMLAIEELGIVKIATLLLKKTKDYDFERVFEIQNNSLNENTKLKCATLLFLSSKWKSLIYTLMMIGSDYEKLEALCQRQIRRWLFSFNNSFAVLSKIDKDIILRLLNDKAQFLKADILKEITFVMK